MSSAPQWRPITISNRAAKEMDRVGGAELILPWPDGLPPGPPPRPRRDASAAEHAAAKQIVRAACRARGLVPVRSFAALERRPHDFARPETIEQHLVVLIIGARWVHATGGPKPGVCWARVDQIERV